VLSVFPYVGQRATNDDIPAGEQELRVVTPAETLAQSECCTYPDALLIQFQQKPYGPVQYFVSFSLSVSSAPECRGRAY